MTFLLLGGKFYLIGHTQKYVRKLHINFLDSHRLRSVCACACAYTYTRSIDYMMAATTMSNKTIARHYWKISLFLERKWFFELYNLLKRFAQVCQTWDTYVYTYVFFKKIFFYFVNVSTSFQPTCLLLLALWYQLLV